MYRHTCIHTCTPKSSKSISGTNWQKLCFCHTKHVGFEEQMTLSYSKRRENVGPNLGLTLMSSSCCLFFLWGGVSGNFFISHSFLFFF